MKTLILGSSGQLGQSLKGTVPNEVQLVGLDRSELDITDATAVIETCRKMRPSVIVNAAAYTAVDQAETETALAVAVNVEGPRNVAAAALEIGARLIHISTDFVFDGKSPTPYKADAATNPLNVYGQTKRDGELAVLEVSSGAAVVIRTSWLYSRYGHNFVKTMLTMMSERDELRVVADQFGTPTWADSLAKAVWAFIFDPEHKGIYHLSNSGETTWHGFAVAIQEEAFSLGLLSTRIPIHAVTTEKYPTAAKRPLYGVLDCSSTKAALNSRQSHWRDNLRQMLIGILE